MNELILLPDLGGVPAAPGQSSVDRLEQGLLAMPQAAIQTLHSFLPGVYERTIRIPPWTVLTGAAHKTDYRVRLERGTIAVNTDDGMHVLTAPMEFAAKAGIKRVGRVFEQEVVWTDIYPNPDNCTDLPTLEARYYELDGVELGENRIARMLHFIRQDYALFIAQLGCTQDLMDKIVQNETDLIPMPEGFDVEVRTSQIHGSGLFALREFNAGDFICPGRINGMRTTAGRFINHSPDPNATSAKSPNDDISAVALRRIQVNEEIVIDYRTSMRVNFGIVLQGEKPCQVG